MFRTSSVHHQERFVQAVCADLVCGNTRTTRHVQPLRSCRENFVYLVGLHIYYKMIHGPYNIKKHEHVEAELRDVKHYEDNILSDDGTVPSQKYCIRGHKKLFFFFIFLRHFHFFLVKYYFCCLKKVATL